MRLGLLLFALLSFVSFNASAGIIGMLVGGDETKVELAKVSGRLPLRIQVTVTSKYDMPVLYFSRYLGGEGGDAMKAMEALAQGRMPEPTRVSEWMAPDTDHESFKIGVFTSTQKHSFTSVFTGQPVNLDIAVSQRLSVKDLKNGLKKQIYEFHLADVIDISDKESMDKMKAGKMDLALVTQERTADGYETELKKAVVVKSSELFPFSAGNSCEGFFK